MVNESRALGRVVQAGSSDGFVRYVHVGGGQWMREGGGRRCVDWADLWPRVFGVLAEGMADDGGTDRDGGAS